jgi:hypothetical protein
MRHPRNQNDVFIPETAGRAAQRSSVIGHRSKVREGGILDDVGAASFPALRITALNSVSMPPDDAMTRPVPNQA